MGIHYDNIPGMNLSPYRLQQFGLYPPSGVVRQPRIRIASSSFIPQAKEVDRNAEGLSSFERGGGIGNN